MILDFDGWKSCRATFKLHDDVENSFTGQVNVCKDPVCDCQVINISFSPSDLEGHPEPVSYDLRLEAREKKVTSSSPSDQNASHFLETFKNNLTNSNWLHLKTAYNEAKYFHTEHLKANDMKGRIKYPFEFENIEIHSQLTEYLLVFPFGRSLSITPDNSKTRYLVDDSYCLNPKHPCDTLMLEFYPESEFAGRFDGRYLPHRVYAPYLKLPKITELEYGDLPSNSPSPKKLFECLYNKYPDLENMFHERHNSLRQLYKWSRPSGSFSKSITLEQEKIGRNSPCPCGSGKKYKKCCLNQLKADIESRIKTLTSFA